MLDLKYYPTQKLITIDGTTLNLTGWGIFLRITRQRAHQLHKAGLLEKHVRIKKQLTEELYKKWQRSRKLPVDKTLDSPC